MLPLLIGLGRSTIVTVFMYLVRNLEIASAWSLVDGTRVFEASNLQGSPSNPANGTTQNSPCSFGYQKRVLRLPWYIHRGNIATSFVSNIYPRYHRPRPRSSISGTGCATRYVFPTPLCEHPDLPNTVTNLAVLLPLSYQGMTCRSSEMWARYA